MKKKLQLKQLLFNLANLKYVAHTLYDDDSFS